MQFSTTADQRIRELRRCYIEIAIEFLKAGDPEGCVATMTDCLSAQAKVVPGLGTVAL
jgi:hypothetical protein